jgi:hypothetical protein
LVVALAAISCLRISSGGATPRPPIQLPTPQIELIAGPLTAADPADEYDSLQLEQGKKWAKSFPAHPSLLEANYYDLAFVLYQIYYRTNDTYWLEQARRVARAWRDWQGNREIPLMLAQKPTTMVPPPRAFSTLGLAVLALESADEAAERVVEDQARLVELSWMHYGDAREKAYSLMALVAATVLGKDHGKNARALLDTILAAQSPDGPWRDEPGTLVSIRYTLNYMNGLMMEALVLYDRAIGDPRILPAIDRCMRWLWKTQWLPELDTFQYGDVDSGSVNTDPAPVLNGLFLPAWGYAYFRRGDPAVREQGDRIFEGLVYGGGKEIWGVKQFDEAFRSSAHYPAFVAARGAGASSDADTDGRSMRSP